MEGISVGRAFLERELRVQRPWGGRTPSGFGAPGCQVGQGRKSKEQTANEEKAGGLETGS